MLTHQIRKLVIFVGIIAFSLPLHAGRVETTIDFDWYFHRGDIDGGERNDMDYNTWRLLDVPHDWSIESEYDKDVPGHRSNGFLPAGIGWYKKEIEWDDDWKGKMVFVEFDGVYMNSTVWINGNKLGYRPNGYLGIRYELTPYLKQGRNVLTVKVDNSLQPSARWYSGSGIYRHVHLIATDSVHVARNGTYITTPDVSPEKATVRIVADIDNRRCKTIPVRIVSRIEDSAGKTIAQGNRTITLKSGVNQIEETLVVESPKLWSPETPDVYYMKTIIESDCGMNDTYTTRFGIRKLEYVPQQGFRLNDVPTKFRGVCMHQNTSPFGIAQPYDTWYKRLTMLKEMGCNAVRTSHYSFPPEFYAMCDTMGLMVMDEPWDGWFQWKGNGKARYDYGYYFLDWWKTDLEDFIKRDRNHPSIMIWCMGNEVWGYEKHQYLQMLINDTFHALDPTRPTTQAWALDVYLDVAGFNANGEGKYDLDEFHNKQPEKLAIGTEIPHTRQTRGVYRTKTSYRPWDNDDIMGANTGASDLSKLYPIPDLTEEEVFPGVDLRYASSYDNQTRKISCRDSWRQTRDHDFYMGEFRWTAFDYLGESWGWPARTNNYGVIDMADFPKDSYYLYQSFWSEKPMVHLLPHWTHPGKEGIEISVVVYTNGEEAELFLNGKSLGRKPMDKDVLQIVWLVPYKAGTVTSVAYQNGKAIARKSISTASKAARIVMKPNRMSLHANRQDLVYIETDIVDEKGTLVPDAANEVTFEIAGPYKLVGVENGDILDQNPNKSSKSKAFMGKTLLVLQATNKPGAITVTATSPGLKSAKQIVKSE